MTPSPQPISSTRPLPGATEATVVASASRSMKRSLYRRMATVRTAQEDHAPSYPKTSRTPPVSTCGDPTAPTSLQTVRVSSASAVTRAPRGRSRPTCPTTSRPCSRRPDRLLSTGGPDPLPSCDRSDTSRAVRRSDARLVRSIRSRRRVVVAGSIRRRVWRGDVGGTGTRCSSRWWCRLVPTGCGGCSYALSSAPARFGRSVLRAM